MLVSICPSVLMLRTQHTVHGSNLGFDVEVNLVYLNGGVNRKVTQIRL